MAQFTIYQSTDSDAPTLSGTAGDLVNLLDKCLVTGYGSKSAAGWTKPFTGTNKAVFKNGGGCQMFFRVQDDAAGGATMARIRGFETMSDVDTGTGLFPTVAQLANGVFWCKSSTASATQRTWILFADDKTCYLFSFYSGTTTCVGLAFGEFYSHLNNDSYRNFVIGFTSESTSASNDHLDRQSVTGTSGHFFARGHTGLGSAVNFGKHGSYAGSGGATTLIGAIPFVNPTDGGVYLSPVWITDPTTSPVNGVRGKMRGFWHFLHSTSSIANYDTLTGTGTLNGKTFIFIKTSGNSSVYCIETSDTLETNE